MLDYIRAEGGLWNLLLCLVGGIGGLVFDSREMENKKYPFEAKLARIVGLGWIVIGLGLWVTSAVLNFLG